MNWIDAGYNTYKLIVIKNVMFVSLSWNTDGYDVECGSRALRKRYPDLTAAKSAGESFAMRLLEEGVINLKELK